jgi:hypothetical protein
MRKSVLLERIASILLPALTLPQIRGQPRMSSGMCRMDVTERGLPLEEAFRQTLTEAERTALDKYEAYKDPVLAWIPGEPPTQYDIFHEKYHQLRQPWQERFMQMLRSGELGSTAVELPTTLNSRRCPVPTYLWDVLEPDFDKSEASGAGLKLIAIEVSEATQPQQSGQLAGPGSHQPSTDRSTAELRLHLSDDNRTLLLGSEPMYFRGRTQQLILRQLFDAYKAGKRLRAQEVLQKANSSADSIAKAFTGSPH